MTVVMSQPASIGLREAASSISVTPPASRKVDTAMTLGAVVPVYNRRANLEILLASLEKQTHDDFVLVVVDDGCTDGTDQLLEQAA